MPTARKTRGSETRAVAESTTASGGPAKRRRVSRACDQCRAAREKCDGMQPVCLPCISQKRPCTYDASPKKRGVQAGYIRTLELSLAWLFDQASGCEDALAKLLMSEDGDGQSLLMGRDAGKANRLHRKWRRSRVHHEVDRMLSGGDDTSCRADRSSPSGDECDIDQNLTAAVPPDLRCPEHPYDQACLTTKETQVLSSNGQQDPPYDDLEGQVSVTAVRSPSHHHPAHIPGDMGLPPNHWRLLDIYFSYTHSWFPVLERQEVLKTLYLYSNDSPGRLHEKAGSGAHAELWSALTLASYQDVASAPQSIPMDSSHPVMSPDDIYLKARNLIPSEVEPFDIQHAKALLLLSLVNIGRGKTSAAWILVGLAKRMCIDLGSEHGSARIQSTLMGTSILDAIILMLRPGLCGLHIEHSRQHNELPVDGLDEWQPWAPCEGFGQSGKESLRPLRTPAYSLSVFNGLHEVFTCVVARLGSEGGVHLQANSNGQLQSLNDALISSAAPSTHMLQISRLWAGVLLDNGTENDNTRALFLESLESFVSRFGECGCPPILAACLATVKQHHSFESLDPDVKQRWVTLTNTITSVWSCSEPFRLTTHAETSSVSRVEAVRPQHFSSTNESSNTHSSPAAFHHGHLLQPTLQPIPSHVYRRIDPGLSAPSYGSADVRHIPDTSTTSNHTMVHGFQPRQANPSAAASFTTQMPLLSQSSLGALSMNYDSLLDDLASTDYVDQVETDSQFMANLGFAPGCDINAL